ncbi:hypothetical protein B9Z07_27905 [Burkholderia cenocepacia]|uniref:Uncharacterized protein n=1 Tax=Burkholderia cenocepacia TaxID=95486 RepID=A0AAD0J8L4_9BURK|nr:hypothetical protein B9Z07_27905 [Burkholderia cenocepacia]ESS36821.1 hypothetical protein P355_1720 [Burkholderia cenocepacia KC-01]PRE36434.1 hypothetical protein C6P63_13600 [Burkholderia cenocepacia]RQU98504.1 hypothetical protein DF042_24270 [Burkholderia cenocepacia]
MRRRSLHGSEVGCGHRVWRRTAGKTTGNCDSSRGAGSRGGRVPRTGRLQGGGHPDAAAGSAMLRCSMNSAGKKNRGGYGPGATTTRGEW